MHDSKTANELCMKTRKWAARIAQGIQWRLARQIRIVILRASRSDSDVVSPEGCTLVRIVGAAQDNPHNACIEYAMRDAGEPDGLAPPRLAHGDEFFGWQTGGKVVCFGWVTYRDRTVGLTRLSDMPKRVFLYNFYTLEKYRGKGLYPALLLAIRYILGRADFCDFIIDVNVQNTASVRGIEKAGFHPVARITYLTILDRWCCRPKRTILDVSASRLFQHTDTRMATAPLDEQITTRVIEDEAAWDAIRRDWDDLFAASPTASAPLDFVWLRGWWQVYKSSLRAGGLRVVTVWREKQLIGALPLYIHAGMGGPLGIRRLGFVSTGEAEIEETCPDYLNMLYLPGEETVCVDALWQAVGRMDWDYLELLDLPEGTPLLQPRANLKNIRLFSRGQCPVADLTGGFDSYLARLSPNSRQQARRLIREGERAGVQFEIIGMDQVGGALDDLVRLHQERWAAEGKPGVFGSPRFVACNRNLIWQLLPVGRVVLARLSLASKPVAVLYGFVTGQTFAFYQSGVQLEDTGPLRSPGNLAHLLLMRALIDRGIVAYDFLRGSSSYKLRLATRENRLIGVRGWRPTPRATVCRSVLFAGRIFGKGWRMLKRGR